MNSAGILIFLILNKIYSLSTAMRFNSALFDPETLQVRRPGEEVR